MNYPSFFDSKNSLNLFGLEDDFNFLSNLYLKKRLPKVLLFSGKKGSGKSTLINHFLYSIFDNENYDKKKLSYINNSLFLNQFKNNIFANIIYINGSEFQTVRVDDIRNLKNKIVQSTISNKDRFIILNDIELFNKNSLNALLKIIEEPTKNNYFFLVYNKNKPLIDTIKSRSLEIKIILNENQRLEIINSLINFFDLELLIDPKSSKLSPGTFVKFNYLCNAYNISLTDNFTDNLSLILNLYKKNKDIIFINLVFFIADFYFNNLVKNNNLKKDKIYEIRSFIVENLNNFMLFNLSQNALINIVKNKLKNE